MRKFLLIALLLCVGINSWAQFRRNRNNTTAPVTSESSLNYANPAEYTIGGIDVTGLNVLDKNAMISLTGLRVGDKIKNTR